MPASTIHFAEDLSGNIVIEMQSPRLVISKRDFIGFAEYMNGLAQQMKAGITPSPKDKRIASGLILPG